MSGLDWNVVAAGASAAAVAALFAVARALRRRRRGQMTTGVHPLGERRIEVVAIDAAGGSKQDPHPRSEGTHE